MDSGSIDNLNSIKKRLSNANLSCHISSSSPTSLKDDRMA